MQSIFALTDCWTSRASRSSFRESVMSSINSLASEIGSENFSPSMDKAYGTCTRKGTPTIGRNHLFVCIARSAACMIFEPTADSILAHPPIFVQHFCNPADFKECDIRDLQVRARIRPTPRIEMSDNKSSLQPFGILSSDVKNFDQFNIGIKQDRVGLIIVCTNLSSALINQSA